MADLSSELTTLTDTRIASALRQAVDGLSLPDQFLSPSACAVQGVKRQRKSRVRVMGTAAAVVMAVSTVGLETAARGVWPWQKGDPVPTDADAQMMIQAVAEDSQVLTQLVSATETASAELGELSLSEPITSGKVEDVFGWRETPSGLVRSMHTGVDFYSQEGDAIHAAADGVVTAVGSYPALGNVVVITHGKVKGSPVSTWYAHVGELKVYVGQQVKRGDVIALAGYTGAVTGQHLHFEVRVSGSPVDPFIWMK